MKKESKMTRSKRTKRDFTSDDRDWHAPVGAARPLMHRIAEETDAGAAVMAVCTLDYLLERLLRASFIKDSQVKSLFNDDRLLQSFHAKVNIAYFFGLIPRAIYHDLKLIGRIRNRFAHTVVADVAFTDPTVAALVGECILGYEVPPVLIGPRWRFRLTVYHIVGRLCAIEDFVCGMKPPNVVDVIGADRWDWSRSQLTAAEIDQIMRKVGSSGTRNRMRNESISTPKTRRMGKKRTSRTERRSASTPV
jgi:hypothetical protein